MLKLWLLLLLLSSWKGESRVGGGGCEGELANGGNGAMWISLALGVLGECETFEVVVRGGGGVDGSSPPAPRLSKDSRIGGCCGGGFEDALDLDERRLRLFAPKRSEFWRWRKTGDGAATSSPKLPPLLLFAFVFAMPLVW